MIDVLAWQRALSTTGLVIMALNTRLGLIEFIVRRSDDAFVVVEVHAAAYAGEPPLFNAWFSDAIDSDLSPLVLRVPMSTVIDRVCRATGIGRQP